MVLVVDDGDGPEGRSAIGGDLDFQAVIRTELGTLASVTNEVSKPVVEYQAISFGDGAKGRRGSLHGAIVGEQVVGDDIGGVIPVSYTHLEFIFTTFTGLDVRSVVVFEGYLYACLLYTSRCV